MLQSRRTVLVIGSLNIDFIASVKHLPKAGETIPAHRFIHRFGGKGANQAIAASRQGATVSMIGCVGSDDSGKAYRKRILAECIDSRGIFTTAKALTGTALIAVDARAENLIIVAAGANGELSPAMIRSRQRLITSAKILLLQQEVPMPAVVESIQIANRFNVPVVLNPSPLKKGFPWGKCEIDTLIVNAGEAREIFKIPADSVSKNLPRWRRALQKNGIKRLIVTRGSKSTLYFDQHVFSEVPALAVKPVDTVGAGDAFAGAFVACRAEGMEILSAIRRANAAGALTTLLPGAQEAIPSRKATEKFLRSRS